MPKVDLHISISDDFRFWPSARQRRDQLSTQTVKCRSLVQLEDKAQALADKLLREKRQLTEVLFFRETKCGPIVERFHAAIWPPNRGCEYIHDGQACSSRQVRYRFAFITLDPDHQHMVYEVCSLCLAKWQAEIIQETSILFQERVKKPYFFTIFDLMEQSPCFPPAQRFSHTLLLDICHLFFHTTLN